MRFLRLAICALLLTPAIAPAQQSDAGNSLQDLSGLWQAKKFFGPEVRGRLIIERTNRGLRADIAGRGAPVVQKGQELSFSLPRGEGAFSGRLDGTGTIRGHWIRGATPLSYGRAASPVELKAAGQGRWSGTVDPGEEAFSFYIFARPNPDGSYAAVLRNPEFDLGNQRGARRLVRAGDSVSLMAARGDAPERALAAGRI